MEVCRGRRFRAAFTIRVLMEAQVNIGQKFGDPELVSFYQRMADLEPGIVPAPSGEHESGCIALVGEKDAQMSAALECGTNYLLTLDRRRLIAPAVQLADLPLRGMTPGDFLKEPAGQSGPDEDCILS